MTGNGPGGVRGSASPWWRTAGQGLAAALVTGLVSAVVTRLLMRVVAVATDGDPHFSWGGLAGIAVFYVACLLPGCVVLAFARASWARRVGWAVFGAGALLLVFMAVNIGIQEASNVAGISLGQWLLVGAAVLAMAAVYVAQVATAARFAVRGLPVRS